MLKKIKSLFQKNKLINSAPKLPDKDRLLKIGAKARKVFSDPEVEPVVRKYLRRKKERSVIKADVTGAERSIRANAKHHKKYSGIC